MQHEQSRSVCIFIGSYILLFVLLRCDCDLLPVQCTSKMFALIDLSGCCSFLMWLESYDIANGVWTAAACVDEHHDSHTR